jgi:hypothetical protein
MPNQTTYTINRTVRPDVGTQRSNPLLNRQYTQTDEKYDARIVTVGTSEETHTPSAEITDEGQTWIRNQSETAGNYLQVGAAAGVYLHRIPPGEAELFWLEPGAVLYLKAATAPLNAEIHIEGR